MTDVHTRHCCANPNHGCKYQDEDCTVVTKKELQEYPCEECGHDEESCKPLQDAIAEVAARHPEAETAFCELEAKLKVMGLLYNPQPLQEEEEENR